MFSWSAPGSRNTWRVRRYWSQRPAPYLCGPGWNSRSPGLVRDGSCMTFPSARRAAASSRSFRCSFGPYPLTSSPYRYTGVTYSTRRYYARRVSPDRWGRRASATWGAASRTGMHKRCDQMGSRSSASRARTRTSRNYSSKYSGKLCLRSNNRNIGYATRHYAKRPVNIHAYASLARYHAWTLRATSGRSRSARSAR